MKLPDPLKPFLFTLMWWAGLLLLILSTIMAVMGYYLHNRFPDMPHSEVKWQCLGLMFISYFITRMCDKGREHYYVSRNRGDTGSPKDSEDDGIQS